MGVDEGCLAVVQAGAVAATGAATATAATAAVTPAPAGSAGTLARAVGLSVICTTVLK